MHLNAWGLSYATQLQHWPGPDGDRWRRIFSSCQVRVDEIISLSRRIDWRLDAASTLGGGGTPKIGWARNQSGGEAEEVSFQVKSNGWAVSWLKSSRQF